MIISVIKPEGVWKCMILMIIYIHRTNIKPKHNEATSEFLLSEMCSFSVSQSNIFICSD